MTATVRTTDCARETRVVDAVMARDGGDPGTGMTVTVAVEDKVSYVTFTVQIMGANNPDGMTRLLLEVNDRLRSKFWQLQSNNNAGCWEAAKLGSYDRAALIVPPEELTATESPPEIMATGGN